MSATVFWQAVKGKVLSDAGSSSIGIIERAFGSPAVLNSSHIPKLEGMEVAGMKVAGELISAIYKHETIRVWAEY